MTAPSGFTFAVRQDREVVIGHHGRQITVLRGQMAGKFLSRLETVDDQELMARVTGNHERGNERR